MTVLRGNLSDLDERSNWILQYAASHESVHLSQLISTEFFFLIAQQYVNLSASVNMMLKNDFNQKKQLPKLIEWKRKCDHLLEYEFHGVSALKIIEAHAVIEGFAGAFSNHDEEGLARVIKHAHGLDSLYSDLVGRVWKGCGFEFTMTILPRVCWLSLQSQNPVLYFFNYMEKALNGNIAKMCKTTCNEFCDFLGVDCRLYSKSIRIRRPEIRDHPSHALWGGYFDEHERISDDFQALEVFMHPGKASPGIDRRFVMPPLSIFDDDMIVLNGPHRERGHDFALALLKSTVAYLRALHWLEGA